ncbi:MAG: protein kinase [Deltaproteobacteria bacterium]
MAKGSHPGPGERGDAAPLTPSGDLGKPRGPDDSAEGRSALFEKLVQATPEEGAGVDPTRFSPASMMGAADGRSALLEHFARPAEPGSPDAEKSRMLVEALASMVAGADGRSLLVEQFARPAQGGDAAAEMTRLAANLLTMNAPGADGRSLLLEQLAKGQPGEAGGAGAQATVANLLASILAAPEGRSLLLQQLAKAGGAPAATRAQPEKARPPTPSKELAPGMVVGRFEMVKEIGSGGFGVVFEARDRDLGRSVAFKAVRPGVRTRQLDAMLLKEAESAASLQHENIVSIFDYGQGEAGPYLVLELLRGETLASRISRGPLPVNEAVHVGTQVARAIAHAHGAGLLHRDLKPGNVFLTQSGGVKVMDLGLAHFFGQPTGLSGTPAYMAPEQWKGEAQDGRTDVFALGVTLHEMLTARRPYEVRADRSTVLDPGPEPKLEHAHVPARLRKLVERCIAKDPAKRPASARAVQEELLAVERDLASGVARKGQLSMVLVLGGILTALGIGGTAAWKFWPRTIAKGAPRTVLVADFENRTGEDVFDGTLEPAIGIALEGAPFITTFKRSTALGTANRLKLDGTGLGEARARLIAQREGIHVVVAGSAEKAGSGYKVSARAIDGFTGSAIAEKTEEVSGKDAVLGAATKLAVHVRTALGDTKPEAVQLKEAETYSASSLEAAHAYALGMKAAGDGESAEARKQYQEALRLDPGMGRAQSGLAVLEYNAGHHAEADRWFQAAMSNLGRMSDREKLRTRGNYYTFKRDADAAVTANEALVKDFPADTAGWANLAVAYQLKRDFPNAVKAARHAIEIHPRNVPQTNNVGLFETYAGNLDEAIRVQQRALEMNPKFPNALTGLALAQFLAGKRDDAVATWSRLQAVDPSAAAEAFADLAVHDGRLSEARALLEKAVQADLASGDTDPAARKLTSLASVHVLTGQPKKAVAAAEQALQKSKEPYVLFAAGRALAEAGEAKRALQVADDLDKQAAAESRMYAELVRAAVASKRGATAEAVVHARAAVKLVDSWLARLALARVEVEAGSWSEALDELDRLEKRRGEGADVYLEIAPTVRFLPAVAYFTGRAREGLKDPRAAEPYRAFLAVKQGDEDPVAVDARKRLARP